MMRVNTSERTSKSKVHLQWDSEMPLFDGAALVLITLPAAPQIWLRTYCFLKQHKCISRWFHGADGDAYNS